MGDIRRGSADAIDGTTTASPDGHRRRSPDRGTVRAVLGDRGARNLRPPRARPAKRSKKSAAGKAVPQPAVAEELDYRALTLAQLRARLPSLAVTDLEALLAYEEATKARAPFQTLLANRITRATAK